MSEGESDGEDPFAASVNSQSVKLGSMAESQLSSGQNAELRIPKSVPITWKKK